jgi:hypothetical protein
MRKAIFVVVFLFSVKFSFAQYLSYTLYEILHKEDVKSSPVDLENKYNGIIGSAFFTDGWVNGRAFTMMKVYPNLKLRFDVHSNMIYLNVNDTVYDITKSGIVQFDLFPNAPDTSKIISFNNGYNFEEVTPEKFVNVLAEGKIGLIKYFRKDIEEVYESSPTYKEKKFLDKDKYYVIENGNGREVTIGKKNLEKLLTDKWDIVYKYAKEKGISAGNEEGWRRLINYYNSLP